MFQLRKPAIVVNFKVYRESSNKNALELAKICDDVATDEGVNIILCVDALDLKEVAEAVSIPVFSQHVDGEDYGAHTGKILPEMVRDHGGMGSLINHSEDQYSPEDIQKAVLDCKKEHIFSLVCVQSKEQAEEVSKLNPDAIAIEPPELIGGDVSVTTADPGIVSDAVEVSSSPVLCGAGVKKGDDVAKAIELGAIGVLVASGVDKAKDPKEALLELIKGIK